MINNAAARARLGEICELAVDGEATVYPSAIDASAAFPLVAIGMPRWTPQIEPCIDRSQFPIAVAVKLPGGDSAATQDQLDQLWQAVASQLDDAITDDPTLGGLCAAAHLDRAEPGAFRVQGHDYPAQLIFINLDG